MCVCIHLIDDPMGFWVGCTGKLSFFFLLTINIFSVFEILKSMIYVTCLITMHILLILLCLFAIAQFRYIKIQPKTIDLSTRLRGLNYRVCGVYSPDPRSDVYCFRLNIKISKLGYFQGNIWVALFMVYAFGSTIFQSSVCMQHLG